MDESSHCVNDEPMQTEMPAMEQETIGSESLLSQSPFLDLYYSLEEASDVENPEIWNAGSIDPGIPDCGDAGKSNLETLNEQTPHPGSLKEKKSNPETLNEQTPHPGSLKEKKSNPETLDEPTLDSGTLNIKKSNPGTSKTEIEVLEAQINELEVEEKSSELKIPVKRKRGRPPKCHQKPVRTCTRVSTRLKKKTNIKNYGCDEKSNYEWSAEEKLNLLRGLQDVGEHNIVELAEYVPTRKDFEIRNQIQMWKGFASQELKLKLEALTKKTGKSSCVGKINSLLALTEEMNIEKSSRLFALSKVFLLIAEYGDLPPPEENDGVDFRAMYRYIHCMLNGTPFYGLNQVTARLINYNLSYISAMIRDQQIIPTVQDILSKTVPRLDPEIRTYSDKKLPHTSSVNTLWTYRDTNPLNLQPTFLQSHNDEDSDEFDFVEE